MVGEIAKDVMDFSTTDRPANPTEPVCILVPIYPYLDIGMTDVMSFVHIETSFVIQILILITTHPGFTLRNTFRLVLYETRPKYIAI